MRRTVIALLLLSSFAVAQSRRAPKSDPTPRSDRSESESSSRDSRIDLSPPAGDAKSHPNSGVADDVLELHPFNPMRALKNVEIGDYYYKQRNYRAAVSRYREALQYKPNDAVATFRLATALEKMNETAEARSMYLDYLRILPEGPFAEEAKEALERLPKPPEGDKPTFGELKPNVAK